MRNILYALAIMTLFTSMGAYSQCTDTYCTGIITTIYVSQGATYIEMDQDMSTLKCNLLSGQYMTLKNDLINRDSMFSTLLAAHSSRNPNVTIRIFENSDDCQVSYVISKY